MPAHLILGAIAAYTVVLVVLARLRDTHAALPDGDKDGGRSGSGALTTAIYGLSLAVYCTSWTFYGAVGTAAAAGWEYLTIYLGPILIFSLGLPVVRRIVTLGKESHTTSIADFLAARFGAARGLAGLVTLIASVGALPYIALQLRSVASSAAAMDPSHNLSTGGEIGAIGIFGVAAVLAAFAIVFGTRHRDATQHNRGMIAAIAFDSVFKLLALLAVGAFALTLLGGGPGAATAAPMDDPFSGPLSTDRFLTLTLLSMTAALCLPRQFHTAVVECQSPRHVPAGAALFVAYLIVIALIVVPITQAGLATPGVAAGSPDLFVLALPLDAGAEVLALFVFVGGFAAATGMVIVASVALSTMITNDLITPLIMRAAGQAQFARAQIGTQLLLVRRLVITVLVMGAAVFAVFAPQGERLASLGILSFAAAAQFAPALIGGVYWKGARRAGAYAGLGAGFVLWLLTLFIPSFTGADLLGAEGPPGLLDATGWDPLTQGVALSLGANILLFITVSLAQRSRLDGAEGPRGAGFAPRLIQSGELVTLVERCLGETAAREALRRFELNLGRRYGPNDPADEALIAFTTQQIARALGASSAQILLRSVLGGGELGVKDVATVLDEAAGKVKFNRDLLQTALENLSHGVSVVDADLKLVAWNKAYVIMYDYPQGFIYAGRPVADLIRFNAERGECGPGEVEEQVARRLAHLRAGHPHTYERVRPDGSVIKIQGMRSDSGAYVTSYTDVSDYKRIEKALRDSERSIQFYTDNVPAMIAYADTDEVIRFANKAYREFFGGCVGAVLGQRISGLMPAEDYAQRKPAIEAALGGTRTTFDIEIDRSGQRSFMQVSYVPQFRPDGTVRGFFGLYQDVTARRRAEAALARTNETLEDRVIARTRELSELNAQLATARQQAEAATASKTRFLAAASHDVLQPLNAARLFASALKEDVPQGSEAYGLSEKIDASIASADRLLRALLNISKLDAGGIAPDVTTFPIDDLLLELENEFALAAAEKGIAFRRMPSSLWVESDRGLLLSALQNLVANAVRYTDEGRVLIGVRRADGGARIDILDTGRGIPETDQAQIFGEFRRLSRDEAISGAGLGLAIVDRIARLLDMPLTLQSQEGHGSRFSLTAPAAAPPAVKPARVAPQAAKSPLAGARVLCVDNDRAVIEALHALLTRWGAEVTAAGSVTAAEAQYPEGTPLPDILILDYQLDRGETCFDVLTALEARWGTRPATLMITASSSGNAAAQAAETGIALLSKPVEPAELRAALSRLNWRSTRPQAAQ